MTDWDSLCARLDHAAPHKRGAAARELAARAAADPDAPLDRLIDVLIPRCQPGSQAERHRGARGKLRWALTQLGCLRGERVGWRVPAPADPSVWSDAELPVAVLERFEDAIAFATDGDVERAWALASPEWQAVYACTEAQDRLYAGGFAFLFEETPGVITAGLAGAATRVGATEHAALFARAAAALPVGTVLAGPFGVELDEVAEAAERAGQLLFVHEDAAFERLQERTPLHGFCADYIRAHPDVFFESE